MNAHKIMVIFQSPDLEASDHNLELATLKDNSTDFLSPEELNYYLTLEDDL